MKRTDAVRFQNHSSVKIKLHHLEKFRAKNTVAGRTYNHK